VEEATFVKPKHIRVTKVGGHAVVCFNDLERVVDPGAELDQLERELQALVGQAPWVSVILDFEDEVFVPYAVFEAVLVRLHKSLGEKLKLCNLPSTVTEHFEINRLATLFNMYQTRDDALKVGQSSQSD
jgi:hypothetical protein